MSAVISQPTHKPAYTGSTLRTLLAFRKDRLSFLQQLQQEHGDVVRFRIATQAVWILSHPDHIRDVLVTNQKKFMKARMQTNKGVIVLELAGENAPNTVANFGKLAS